MMRGPIINGEPYVLVVLRVVERDEFGRPAKVTMGYDDTTFTLDGDPAKNEFITAFVKESAVPKQTRN